MSYKSVCLGLVACHLVLILTVSSRDIFKSFSQGNTCLPTRFDFLWQKAEAVGTAALGQTLLKRNAYRQGVGAYLACTGIDTGYSFFAPHVPASYKLVFEVHYPHGRIEYEIPKVSGPAAMLRVASLLDVIGQVEDVKVRAEMLKLLVHAVWREHPDASMVRAVFGTVNFPTAAEFANGRAESYRVLAAYDVTAEPTPQP